MFSELFLEATMSDALTQRQIGDFLLKHETAGDIELYIAIGRVVIEWGGLEQNFSHVVAWLYRHHGGSKLVSEPPFGLKRQIEFFNDCFKELPHLSPIRKQAERFARGFTTAKKNRDDLLHFSWTQPAEQISQGRSIKASRNGHVRRKLNLPIKALIEFATNLRKLNTSFLLIILVVYCEPPPQ